MTDEPQSTHSAECWLFGKGHYECAVREVERLQNDARRWRELVDTWGGMQQRHGHVEIGISTPRWRVPDDVDSFGEAFDRRYELDDVELTHANGGRE